MVENASTLSGSVKKLLEISRLTILQLEQQNVQL